MSYLVGRDSLGKPDFVIQFRSIDSENVPKVLTDFPITTVIEKRIVFCPSCGVNLGKWYGPRVDELHREGIEIGSLN